MISARDYASNRRDEETTEQIAEGNYTGEVMIYGMTSLSIRAKPLTISLKIKEAQEGTEAERQGWIVSPTSYEDGVIAPTVVDVIVIIKRQR